MQKSTDPTVKNIVGTDIKNHTIEREFGIENPDNLRIQEYEEISKKNGCVVIFPNGKPQICSEEPSETQKCP